MRKSPLTALFMSLMINLSASAHFVSAQTILSATDIADSAGTAGQISLRPTGESCYLSIDSGAFFAGRAISSPGLRDTPAMALGDIDSNGDLDFTFADRTRRHQVTGLLMGWRESGSYNGHLGQNAPTPSVVRTTTNLTQLFANQTLTVQSSLAAVERFDVFEIILSASQDYQNPYQEASVIATFVGPTGSRTLPGFWDGGDVWRIRFSPDAVGSWSYSTDSNDPGLVTSGTFDCIASARSGGIKPRSQTPLHFQHQDGTSFWWLGETCWAAFRSDAGENLSSTTFREYIDVRSDQGFNFLHGNLLAGPNEGGSPFKGSVVGQEVNPAFWKEVDERVKYMNDHGIAVGMLLSWKSDKVGAGSSNPVFDFDWTDFVDQGARLRFCRYVAARYSAYNVVWILAGEYNEGASIPPNTAAHWTELANAVKNNDPHDRMMAIHGQDQVEVFADESWMNFGDYMQFYDNLHSAVLDARDHAKPVINAEYAYFLRDQDSDGVVDKPNSTTIAELRHASWDIVMAGGYFISGFGTTYLGGKRDPGPFDVNASKNDPAESQLPLVKAFFGALEWWKFQPADNFMTGNGTKYCLSDFAGNYVAYVRGSTNPVQLQVVEGTTGEYIIQRFDPRIGTFLDLPSQTTSTSLSLTTPTNEDWVFRIERSGNAPNPVPIVSSFNPPSGPSGTQVTISGDNFTGATAVRFNGAAATFNVLSDGEIRATVPAGATTGKISVTNAFGTSASPADFIVIAGSGGTGTFSPKHDAYVRSSKPTQTNGPSTDLIVRKSSSNYRAYFKFEVMVVSGAVQSAKLRLFVSEGSRDGGGVYLVSNNYAGTSTPWVESGLNWNNAPQISGNALSALTSVTSGTTVEFDVTAAVPGNGIYSFAIRNNSSDAVNYRSKEGANPPQLVITTGSGSANPPVITSFAPTSGQVGTVVTISGSNFSGAISVMFGGVATSNFDVSSNSQVIATVPTGAATGKIQVSTAGGTASSPANFTVTAPPAPVPIIASFTPATGVVGTLVTINGSNFVGTIAVTFNNVAAQFAVVSNSELSAAVPTGASSGKIRVTNAAGLGVSAQDFVITTVPSEPQTLTFQPAHDAFVWSANPSNNYGGSNNLRVRKTSALQIAYFKFNVTGLNGSVANAKLVLLCEDASNDAGSVYLVSNNYLNTNTPWTENGLLWTNAPAVSGTALSSLRAVSAGQTVEFNLALAVNANGVYTLAIRNNSSDAVYYSSKEGTQKPELVITTGSSSVLSKEVDAGTWDDLSLQKGVIPEQLTLPPNYPNPFNAETTIEYGLPEVGPVRLVIYNLRGQEVRTLVDELQSAGFKAVRWDGRDNLGSEVNSAMYFARIIVGRNEAVRKLTFQK